MNDVMADMKNLSSPSTALEISRFEMPAFEMPAAIRDLAEKRAAEAKQNCEKMKTATHKITAMVETTYSAAANGTTDYGLKVTEMTRANTRATFDFLTNVLSVKSPSEAIGNYSPSAAV